MKTLMDIRMVEQQRQERNTDFLSAVRLQRVCDRQIVETRMAKREKSRQYREARERREILAERLEKEQKFREARAQQEQQRQKEARRLERERLRDARARQRAQELWEAQQRLQDEFKKFQIASGFIQMTYNKVELQKQYRQDCMRLHPDRNHSATAHQEFCRMQAEYREKLQYAI